MTNTDTKQDELQEKDLEDLERYIKGGYLGALRSDGHNITDAAATAFADYVMLRIHALLKQHTTTLAERKAREAEERAARKIQAVINAHQGLNSDGEVLKLVECSLPVIDQLEAEDTLKEKNNGKL